MAHSHNHTNKFTKDLETARRTTPYRRTKFRLEISSIDEQN